MRHPAHSPEEKQGLGPNDPFDWLAKELAQQNSDLMVVGHLPFLQSLASLLLTGSDAADLIHFQAGGVVCLERVSFGAWQLANEFLLNAEQSVWLRAGVGATLTGMIFLLVSIGREALTKYRGERYREVQR